MIDIDATLESIRGVKSERGIEAEESIILRGYVLPIPSFNYNSFLMMMCVDLEWESSISTSTQSRN